MPSTEPTFRKYSNTQAASYAANRGSYTSALYEEIFRYHKSTGGSLGKLLDCGCGPGNATRELASHFQHAIGIDPGEQMIATAQDLGGTTAGGEEVRYAVAGAEDLQKLQNIERGSIDMVTAAMAAHWFDMPSFWRGVDYAMKPGGTVALWTMASLYCHPSTTNAAEVQQHLSNLETNILAPYELVPNRISRNLYRTLPKPWDVFPPVESFEQDQFVCREWDVDGKLSNGQGFFCGSSETTLGALEASLGTASMVTRWREAHPTKSGTGDDCVVETMRRVRQAMNIAPGEDAPIKVSGATALLMFKKR